MRGFVLVAITFLFPAADTIAIDGFGLPLFTASELAEVSALDSQIETAARDGRSAEARRLLERRLQVHSADPAGWYDLACYQALAGELKRAQRSLDRALVEGFRNADWAAADPDLASLSVTQSFGPWLERVRAAPAKEPGPGPELARTEDELESTLAEWTEAWHRIYDRLGPSEAAWAADRARLSWAARSWDHVGHGATDAELMERAGLEAIRSLSDGGIKVHPEFSSEIQARVRRFLLGASDPALRATARHYDLKARYQGAGQAARLAEDSQSLRDAQERYVQDLLLFAATTEESEVEAVLVTLMEWAASESRHDAADLLYERLAKRFPDEGALQGFLEETGYGIGEYFERRGTPSFQVTDLGGMQWDSRLLAPGFTLVEFWATWCQPCLKEIPAIRRAHAMYGELGLDVLGISIDEGLSAEALATWAKSHGVEWSLALASSDAKANLAERFRVTGLPATYLLNESGEVVASGAELRGGSLATTLKRLFGQ